MNSISESIIAKITDDSKIKKECGELLISLRKETIGDQAKVSHQLVVQNKIQQESLKVLAEEVFDLDIQNEGLRDQLQSNLNEESLKKYCNSQIKSKPSNDKRSIAITNRLLNRIKQAEEIVKNK